MLSLSVFSLIFLLSLFPCLILLYKWFSVPSSDHPPSPPKLPIIGNLHQLGSAPHRSFRKLSKQYGPLMQLHLGKVPVLVISSAELACQVMKTDDLIFASRPKASFTDRLLYGPRDIAFAPYGEHWRKARSIFVHRLLSPERVKSYRNIREEETSLMLQKIEKLCTFGPVNLTEMFVSLTNDIICRAALGRKYNDTEYWKDLISSLRESITMLGVFNIRDYIPWLGWVNYFTGLDSKFDDLCKKTDELLELVIEENRKNMEKSGGVCVSEADDDFVDTLLKLQRGKDASIQNESIKAQVWDTFAAGTDSLQTVLEWTMSELLRKPKTMEKLQSEVRQIAQGKSNIGEDEVFNMKYLKAVIKETLRLHSAPLLLRKTTQDVNLMGYAIKSGTEAFVNVWAIARDHSYWDNPEEFEPERFLNSNIDFNGFNFEFLPFGAGRRGCPGAAFAMAVIEPAIAKLVQKFNFSLPNGLKAEDLDMTDVFGILVHRNDPLQVDITVFDTAC